MADMTVTSGQVIVGLVVLNFNVLWLLLYALVIRRGHLDKTFGIPAFALCANFAWDIYNSIDHNITAMSPMPQPIIDGMYAIVDLVIIYQVLRYWRGDFKGMPPLQFYVFFAMSLVLSFLLMMTLIEEMGDVPMWRSAFIDTFLCSALFIAMFYRRPNLEGQSLYIGLCKLLGTGPFMLMLYFAPQLGPEARDLINIPYSTLFVPLWVGIFILDLIYVMLVYRRSRDLGLNPWRRF
jgi:hypothetical protein